MDRFEALDWLFTAILYPVRALFAGKINAIFWQKITLCRELFSIKINKRVVFSCKSTLHYKGYILLVLVGKFS